MSHRMRGSRRPARRIVRELIQGLGLAIIMYLAVQVLVLPYEVDGASMDPSLHNGERLLVNRHAYAHFDANQLLNAVPGIHRRGRDVIYPFHAPSRGDIIVFHPPVPSDEPYIKRVIGLAGERVTFHGGHVYINGDRLDEPYIHGAITGCRGTENCDLGPIPSGYVFALGDNRQHSADSREFGLVRIDRIIGQAVFANWPLTDIGLL